MYCIEGWVGLRAGLDWCGKSRPHWDSILKQAYATRKIALSNDARFSTTFVQERTKTYAPLWWQKKPIKIISHILPLNKTSSMEANISWQQYSTLFRYTTSQEDRTLCEQTRVGLTDQAKEPQSNISLLTANLAVHAKNPECETHRYSGQNRYGTGNQKEIAQEPSVIRRMAQRHLGKAQVSTNMVKENKQQGREKSVRDSKGGYIFQIYSLKVSCLVGSDAHSLQGQSSD